VRPGQEGRSAGRDTSFRRVWWPDRRRIQSSVGLASVGLASVRLAYAESLLPSRVQGDQFASRWTAVPLLTAGGWSRPECCRPGFPAADRERPQDSVPVATRALGTRRMGMSMKSSAVTKVSCKAQMTLKEASDRRPPDQIKDRIKECPMSRVSSSAGFKKDSVRSRRSIGLAGLLVLGALLPAAALAASGGSGLAGSAPENATVAVTHGPIWGGRQHQPQLADVIARETARGEKPGVSAETSQASDQLYRRVLEQSRRATPRRLDQTE
jgi:hypothetical protein